MRRRHRANVVDIHLRCISTHITALTVKQLNESCLGETATLAGPFESAIIAAGAGVPTKKPTKNLASAAKESDLRNRYITDEAAKIDLQELRGRTEAFISKLTLQGNVHTLQTYLDRMKMVSVKLTEATLPCGTLIVQY